MRDKLNDTLPDLSDTEAFAARFGQQLKPGDVVLMFGDLGVGKSAFCRALIKSLPLADGGVSSEAVPSPTFTLVQRYERGIAPIFHFDLYRLGDEEELFELGIDEAFSEGISLIEWPDRLGSQRPSGAFEVHLTIADDDARKIIVEAPTGRLSALHA